MEEQTRYNKLAAYEPTDKQLEFHNLGAAKRERMLGAGNQSGKTFSAGMEVAMHMTGRYPEWWKGHRYTSPVQVWAAGVTGESTRDNPQRILLGEKQEWGTGTIPRDLLHNKVSMARGGVPDLADSFQTQHLSGGVSTCWFKSYEKGREKWQGQTLDLIWNDEEPPWDIFREARARLINRKGHMLITFTPLMGMTQVVRLFYEPDADDPEAKNRGLVIMDIGDATFYSKEHRREILEGYTEAEKRSRAHGLPHMGEGLVYPIHDEEIALEPFQIPSYFRRIVGFDFGLDHPAAGVVLVHNPDDDMVYLTQEYKQVADSIPIHASGLKALGGDHYPVAWPHDGLKRMSNDIGGAVALVELYRKEGINMLVDSARYGPDKGGPQPLEPVIAELLDRMRDGTFKVFSNCRQWFKEKNNWFRKDGKPYGIRGLDDLMAATRYAMMMLRYARPDTELPRQTQAQDTYDPLTWSPAGGRRVAGYSSQSPRGFVRGRGR